MSYQKQKRVIHSIRTEVDSFGRKKYRLQEQVIQSGEQEQVDDKKNVAVVDTGRHKSMLIGRQEGLGIEKYIGKIDTNKKKKATEVFYCDICSEGFKCDMAYITHINSPAHNRKLGMSMKVKSVSLQTVSSKISQLINKKMGKSQQQQNDKQEDELVKKLQGRDSGVSTVKRVNSKNHHRNATTKRQQQQVESNHNDSEHQDDDDDEQCQLEIKHQQDKLKLEEEQQQQEQQPQQDSNELAQQQMMLMMGIGKKKLKR